MGYFKERDRERNREIFKRIQKYGVRYRVSTPPEHLLPKDASRMPISKSTAYKSVGRMKEAGILDAAGKVTPLGVEVSGLVGYVMEKGDVSHSELEKLFGAQVIEAAVRTGQISRAEPHYEPREEERPSLWDLPLSEVFAFLFEDAFRGQLMTPDGKVIVPKVLFVRDKQSRLWLRKKVGSYFTLEKAERDKDQCLLAALVYLLFDCWKIEGEIGFVIQDYDVPSTPRQYPPVYYELKEEAERLEGFA